MKKKVWLLGDSIRGFYGNRVTELLNDEYEVFSPNENCRFSLYLFNSLRHYAMQSPKPDIIHWNIGLWDTAVLYKEDGNFIALDLYIETIRKILRELEKTGAKIIFATTTPVADKKAEFEGPFPPAHYNEDIIKYNREVVELISNEYENVLINDLHSELYEIRDKAISSEDLIHPSEYGVEILAKAVVGKIKSVGDYININRTEMNRESVSFEEKTIQ